jgi:hypothetical protein
MVWKTTGLVAAIVVSLGSATIAMAASEDREALSRSFYVPVEVRVCEHLEGAVLYRGDQPLTALPGQHVFQFTFFPGLGRIEPEIDRVRVEGRLDGAPFRTEIVVTPASIYVGSKKIELALDKEMEQLRTRVDVRHEKVELKLKCGSACSRNVSSESR